MFVAIWKDIPSPNCGREKAEGEAKVHSHDTVKLLHEHLIGGINQEEKYLWLHIDQWSDRWSDLGEAVNFSCIWYSREKHKTIENTAFTLSLAHSIR